MEYDPRDQVIIDLLTKLKSIKIEYPGSLLAIRRDQFLRQVIQVAIGIGIGTKLKNLINGENGNTSIHSYLKSKTLEILLATAIAAEAGALAYLYHDQAKLIQSPSSSSAAEVTSPSIVASSLPPITFTALEPPTPISTSTSTAVITLTDTPLPVVPAEVANTTEEKRFTSTPVPKDNNGNHYGQTPKPERTKRPDRESKPTKTPKK